MATTFSLSPLLRSSIGFDRFDDLFESSFGRNDAASAYPPYNVERWGNDEYRIIFAVAGFSDDELNITVKDNVLMVEGRAEQPAENDVTYLHRGIAKRAFRRNFRLAEVTAECGAERRLASRLGQARASRRSQAPGDSDQRE